MIEESALGPVIGADTKGRKLACRWIEHDSIALNLRGALELEAAGSAFEALRIAYRMGSRHQNMAVGDADGAIGRTVTTALPRRFGFGGRAPMSWADGDKGWNGYLAPKRRQSFTTPTMGAYGPPMRAWSGATRCVSSVSAITPMARGRQIPDSLFSGRKFAEPDLLAIQLDDRGFLLDRGKGFSCNLSRGEGTSG